MAAITSEFNWVRSFLVSLRVFDRQCILSSQLITNYPTLKYQIADIFIKMLGSQEFIFLQSKLRIVNLHGPT